MAFADSDLELREWQDRLAIQNLIYRYADAVTRADWDPCEAVLAAERSYMERSSPRAGRGRPVPR